MKEAVSLDRFASLWTALGLTHPPAPVYNQLITRYAEPHRAYHTLDHVADCLMEYDRVKDLITFPHETAAALWFHDIVYDTKASDNEEKSADLAVNVMTAPDLSPDLSPGSSGLSSGLSPGLKYDQIREKITRVRMLILSTKHGGCPQDTPAPDSAYISDIDLTVLGRPSDQFDAYDQQIRQEYAWVPMAMYRQGRVGILQDFLKRDRIYLTDHFFNLYENTARINLSRAVERLSEESNHAAS